MRLSVMSRTLKRLGIALLILTSMTGCVHGTPANSFCLIYEKESFTQDEWDFLSDESERPVLRNLAAYEELCP